MGFTSLGITSLFGLPAHTRIGHTGARASWSVVQHRIDTGRRVGGDRGNRGGG